MSRQRPALVLGPRIELLFGHPPREHQGFPHDVLKPRGTTHDPLFHESLTADSHYCEYHLQPQSEQGVRVRGGFYHSAQKVAERFMVLFVPPPRTRALRRVAETNGPVLPCNIAVGVQADWQHRSRPAAERERDANVQCREHWLSFGRGEVGSVLPAQLHDMGHYVCVRLVKVAPDLRMVGP